MALNKSFATPEGLRDPDYMPPPGRAVPLGIRRIPAMFVGNVTPAIVVAGAVGLAVGTEGVGGLSFMIPMSMFFAGIATVLQLSSSMFANQVGE